MICFHFIIFEPSETTSASRSMRYKALWFAFISLSLSHQKQHYERICVAYLCCDLLSFHYLWAIRNNDPSKIKIFGKVVICFHFIIFEPSETTFPTLGNWSKLLWFAFISLSLSHQKQPVEDRENERECCDLLSFHYLWAIRNNNMFSVTFVDMLWFAFISLSLSHQKQQVKKKSILKNCCDLLSFHYLWAIRNNPLSFFIAERSVVICFHFIIFEPSETTGAAQSIVFVGCDLLSFHYLWAIRNNRLLSERVLVLLWFAFISLSLSHQKQHILY